MDGESVCGIIPRCDYCGEPDAGNPPDWNGETGNHRSCEPKPAVTLPSLANLGARGMSTVREIADSIMGELDVEVYDSALPQPWVDEIHRRTGQWPQEYGVVWAYRASDPFGGPMACTVEAAALLDKAGETYLP